MCVDGYVLPTLDYIVNVFQNINIINKRAFIFQTFFTTDGDKRLH
jgi:hypothetical protein